MGECMRVRVCVECGRVYERESVCGVCGVYESV